MGVAGVNRKNKTGKDRKRYFCLLMAALCLWGTCTGGDVRAEKSIRVKESVRAEESVKPVKSRKTVQSVQEGRKLREEEAAQRRIKFLFVISACGVVMVLCGIGFLDEKKLP